MLTEIWKRFLNQPTYDKVFYVPFWDCPYQCDFCCVDSLPGKPPIFPDDGEDLLFEVIEKLHQRFGKKIELHLYGGEPMMRKRYVEHLAKKVLEKSHISKLILYTTLLSNSPKGVYDILGKERLHIIYNPATINEKVKQRAEEFKDVASTYKNQVFFPTGRGAVGMEGNQANFWQNILPIGFPARSCFANSSGMLINGPQHTVHLCCLPQSPIIGTFHDKAIKLVEVYEKALSYMPQEINAEARRKKCVHPCQVCNSKTGYKSQAGAGCNDFTLEVWKQKSL
ncbi:MAG: radical SAM protein [Chitinophagales bacterium]